VEEIKFLGCEINVNGPAVCKKLEDGFMMEEKMQVKAPCLEQPRAGGKNMETFFFWVRVCSLMYENLLRFLAVVYHANISNLSHFGYRKSVKLDM
jgi:hypothetical protein